jgi:hypothetical protein
MGAVTRGLHNLVLVVLAVAGAVASAQPAGPFAPPVPPDGRPPGTIDVLDYFLQSDDAKDEWTIGGTDVREEADPEGTDARTIVLNKWSSPDYYEVYHVTPTDLRLRYEVWRDGGRRGNKDSWIRRYEEIGADGQLGSVWCKRFVVPGGGRVPESVPPGPVRVRRADACVRRGPRRERQGAADVSDRHPGVEQLGAE